MSKSIYRLLKKLIDTRVKGANIFKHNGSTWLIFENDKRWVIELTKGGTLWYNFYFFQDIFELIGLDEMVNNQHHITKWVEDTIINGVKDTRLHPNLPTQMVEDTIQNGVRLTNSSQQIDGSCVIEDTIENGIKLTTTNIPMSNDDGQITEIEDVITNGIKETKSPGADGDLLSTIEWMESNNTKSVPEMIDDVIENGIKETKKLEHDRTTYHGYFSQERGTHTPLDRVQDVLKNGVKETQAHVLRIYNPMNFEPVFKEDKRMVEIDDVLENGIREIQPLPAQDGNRDWGNYYYRKGEPTKPHTKYVDEVIENGIKENPSF